MTRRILAVDPSTRRTGWAIMDGHSVLASGAIRRPKIWDVQRVIWTAWGEGARLLVVEGVHHHIRKARRAVAVLSERVAEWRTIATLEELRVEVADPSIWVHAMTSGVPPATDLAPSESLSHRKIVAAGRLRHPAVEAARHPCHDEWAAILLGDWWTEESCR